MVILLFFYSLLLYQSEALRGPEYIVHIQLLEQNGLHHEKHVITTDDGYLLQTFRVCKDSCDNKPPVFLQHGIANTGEHFLYMGPDVSLGFILANNDYDVWIGNSRGTPYSRMHKTLDPDKDAAFWKFSFHEKGYYDLPANIDYILNITGKKQLYYVGHSEGTSSFYVMGSTRPEYNAKVKAQISLSCIVYIQHIRSVIFQLLAKFLWIEEIIEKQFKNDPQFYDINIPLSLTSFLGYIFCSDSSPTQLVCSNLLVEYVGFTQRQLNNTLIPRILSYNPSETSYRQYEHIFQLIRTGKFAQYDYGLHQNLERYKTPNPPNYDLKKMTVPIYLFLGEYDFVCNLTEVQTKTIPQFVNFKGQRILPWDHNDLVGGIDVKPMINDRIVCLLDHYETGKGNDKNCLE